MGNKTPPPKLTFPDITELKPICEKTVVRVNQEAHGIVSDIHRREVQSDPHTQKHRRDLSGSAGVYPVLRGCCYKRVSR